MVDWHDPAIMIKQAEALLKLVHVMDGIYIWEFVSTCGYEWRIVRGEQRWRWTLVLYLGARFFTLAEVITDLIGFNVTSAINCEAWIICAYSFAYTASSMALTLYGLRTIAIWRRNRLITAFIATISTCNVGLWAYTIVKARATWSDALASCVITETDKGLPSTSSTLAVNTTILATMVIGILRSRPQTRSLIGLFWREGVFWLLFATIVQILPSTFVALNLNDTMNLMFQTPTLICSTIGATRIYRYLSMSKFGDVMEYWDSSIDQGTGEVRFRRRINPIGSTPSVAVPMTPAKRDRGGDHERYIERFEAREIKLEEAEVEPDGKADGYNYHSYGQARP